MGRLGIDQLVVTIENLIIMLPIIRGYDVIVIIGILVIDTTIILAYIGNVDKRKQKVL